MAKRSKKGEDMPKKNKEKGFRVSRGIANPVRNLIVTACVSLLLGLAFFLKPYEMSLYLGYGAGGLLGIVGIVYILIYFLRKPVSGVYRSEFVIGLVALLAGAYVALSGLISSTGGVGYVMIVRIIGVLIVCDGLLKVQYAVDIGRMKFRAWWAALIIAVLSIGVGVITATDFAGKTITSSTTAPVSLLYNMGGSMGLGSKYGAYAAFYGGMKMLGIGFMVNAVLDLAVLIILAVRNSKASRQEALTAAEVMMADAKREEVKLPPEPAPEPVYDEVVFPAVPSGEPAAPAPEPVFVPETPAPGPEAQPPAAE